MPIRATPVAHGRAAFDALADAVRAAKHGDPLAPVAVIVPTNTAGVMARRAIGRRGGAAAIDVLTLYRVAELLGAPSLLAEGRHPVSTPVVDLAVKQVIRATPGLYAEVNRHPSTVVALRDLHREVRIAGPAALTALARTTRGSEPARVAAEVTRQLAHGWYDEGDLLARAADRVRTDLPARLQNVVVHVPERLRPLELDLIVALGEAGSVELVVGLTGNDHADASVIELVLRLTGHSCPPAPPGQVVGDRVSGSGRGEDTSSAAGVDLMSTTDADDEVRLAVRAVVDAARRGVRFDRMAVLWPSDRPYARMVEHQLAAAGVPWNGRPGTRVDERMVPRVLVDLLELDRRGLRRTALMTLLGDVPARHDGGRPVPTARWERIGRRAGIIREADWDTHLPRAITEAYRRELSDDARAAEQLQEFVVELRAALGRPQDERGWSDWVVWSHQRLERWFGWRGLDRLDGAEREAWEQTQRVLDRLGHLDSIGHPVTRAEFRATFVAELEVTPGRQGRIGDGVHVGSLAGATGLDVDVAVLVGAADGLLPPPPVVDPLVGDGDRRAAGLVSSRERVEVAHRHFLAIVETTPTVLITMPRGDLRATTAHHPSRWISDLVTRGSLRSSIVIESHAHGLVSTEFPVSPTEHRIRELWTRCRAGDDVRTHPIVRSDAALARALALRDARSSALLTVYDGDLTSRPVSRLSMPTSPSRIEQWSRCPHAYFLRYVLGVRAIDEPEDIESLSPLDRGSALHEAIDRLQQAVLGGEVEQPGPHGWTPVHRALLARAGAEVADELEEKGRTGRVAFWSNERAAFLAELDRWICADTEQWAGRRLRASERRFGEDKATAVALGLPDGRSIAFFGQIDRIDELPDGSLVVTDHKTGRADALSKLSADDPTMGAAHFQLPVYAAAAATLLDAPGATVRAEYAFFDKGSFRRIGFTFDEEIWQRVGHDLAAIVDGIEAGIFPSRPEPPAWRRFVVCDDCEPDGLGTAERWSEWDRKRHDPRLARWFPDPADGAGHGAATTQAAIAP